LYQQQTDSSKERVENERREEREIFHPGIVSIHPNNPNQPFQSPNPKKRKEGTESDKSKRQYSHIKSSEFS
jgi:hypothetical protein